MRFNYLSISSADKSDTIEMPIKSEEQPIEEATLNEAPAAENKDDDDVFKMIVEEDG